MIALISFLLSLKHSIPNIFLGQTRTNLNHNLCENDPDSVNSPSSWIYIEPRGKIALQKALYEDKLREYDRMNLGSDKALTEMVISFYQKHLHLIENELCELDKAEIATRPPSPDPFPFPDEIPISENESEPVLEAFPSPSETLETELIEDPVL